MRFFNIIFFFILSVLTAKAEQNDSINYLHVGDYVPEFSINNENGKTTSSKELKGKTTVIVFFATWCPPCRKELPHIQKDIWGKYKGNKNFKLLVIGREHTYEELSSFKKSNNLNMPMIADTDRSIFSLFAKQNIPRTYLIDKSGKILNANIGFNEKEYNKLTENLKIELNSK